MRVVFLIMVCLLAMVSCRTSSDLPSDPAVLDQDALPLVLDGMTARAASLQQLHGYGVIELRWKDQEGDHFEQGDVEFWLDGPSRRAMRISKLGDPYFWIGTDGVKLWLFDLSSRPTQLLIDELSVLQNAEAVGFGVASVAELMRILPLGLGTIPPETGDVLGCQSTGDGEWLLQFQPRGAKVERESVTLDSDTWRPVQVSLLNANGTAGLVLNTPSPRKVRVDIPGQSSLGSPLVSAILEISILGDSRAEAKFALENLSTDMSEQPLDRLFELNVLRQALQPEREGSLLESGAGRVP
ncbi:MAG: hypothetical protein MK089_08690 [Phycisphaerales bacterium]|nr:hypothetical protein [Phycisphaerales bacterium]